MKVEGVSIPSQPSSETLGSGLPPSYHGDATGQSSTHTQHTESEHDEFGTILSEVTVVTTNSTSTVTTRKKYRVEDALEEFLLFCLCMVSCLRVFVRSHSANLMCI